jgi:hypothetical protein
MVSIAQVVLELCNLNLDIGAIQILLSKEIYRLISLTIATQVLNSQKVPVWDMKNASKTAITFALTHLFVTLHTRGQLVQYATRNRDIIQQVNKDVCNVNLKQRLYLKW